MGNVLKAFLGSNFLTIPFAFLQSGLVSGIVFLILIALMTDHCCQLIIKCKYHVIRRLVQRRFSRDNEDEYTSYQESSSEAQAVHLYKQKLQRCLDYGDVGKFSFGTRGIIAVDAALLLTQFGFCVGYFIFVGSTIQSLFPVTPTNHSSINNSTNFSYVDSLTLEHANAGYVPSDWTTTESLNVTDSVLSTTQEPSWSISTAPSLKLLVLFPLPLFLLFAYIRRLRNLGGISVLANFCIFFGYVAVLYILISGFEISPSVIMFNVEDFLIFFGMVTGSFEGIGTIVPIEASMEGNRHNYPKFLHLSILFLAIVLTTFGILGYLRYGIDVKQMINANVPPDTGLGMAINICLIFGVVFTFPLQIYPVIEIVEKYLFSKGKICGADTSSAHIQEEDLIESESGDKDALIPKQDFTKSASMEFTVPASTPTWKRNIVRTFIVLVAAGLAVLLRNNFAYIGGFVGAVGSSTLAFILPCLCHLKICWRDLPLGIKIKDVTIIILGTVGGSTSLYLVILKIIQNT